MSCCKASPKEPGCAALPAVETCVCGADPYCCEERWDIHCTRLVGELGCGEPCHPVEVCGAAPANGLCEQAAPLAVGVKVAGSTGGESKSGSPCGGHMSPEAWYSYTATEAVLLKVKVTASFDATVGCAPPLQPVVYVRKGCGGEDLACGQNELSTDKLDPGVYLIAVDGRQGDAGAFEIELTTEPPCKGDLDCEGQPAAPACDAEAGRCVRCTSDVHCASPSAPACDGSRQQCVQCTVDSHCKAEGKPRCDADKSQCVGCLSNNDCKDASLPFCDLERNACSACLEDVHCTDPTKPACNRPTGLCVKKGNCCESTAGVAGCADAAIEACVCAKDDYCCGNKWDNVCAEEVEKFGCGLCGPSCASDAQCTDPAEPICVPSASKCAECASNANCKNPQKPACRAGSFRCVACTSDADCGDPQQPRCDPSQNGCVECVADGDCKDPQKPRCSAANACVACLSDDDCSSPKTPACNAETEACAECMADFHCADPARPACNAATKKCVKKGNCCESTSDIAGCESGPIESCVCASHPECCAEGWAKDCVGLVETLGCGLCGPPCSGDGDCGDPQKPACVTGVGRCAACNDDGDCKDPQKPECSAVSYRCVGPCCEVTLGKPGCGNKAVQDCVCAADPYCCSTQWDATCVNEVGSKSCGATCAP